MTAPENHLSQPLVNTLHRLREMTIERDLYREALGELARTAREEIKRLEARIERLTIRRRG